ncbi:hypothetical protein [Streptomyces sp. Rer75]|uniref:hypothetical protein n=1 Tax=Streptomyces sp. Rer75 TaxID=2750011 RepID=UPI00211EC8D5|nr:hypothetical protein [Streptomyces sp. Rer75]
MLGVDLEARPGLLQHLGDVPLGHTLLDPARENLCRGLALAGAAVSPDRLVGGQQGHSGLFELVLDLGAEVGGTGDSLHRFADHCIEPAIRAFCFFQQVLDAAVPGDRDLELLVSMTSTTLCEAHTPGFHVVKVNDDQCIFWQDLLAVAQLTRQGQRGVLQVAV